MSYISDFKSAPIDLLDTSTDMGQLVNLTGSRWRSADGRTFAIIQNGATALTAAHVVSSVAPTANHEGLAVTAFTSGSTTEPGSAPFNPPAQNGPQYATVTVTLGGTAALAGEYNAGYVQVKSGTGIGQLLRILSNPAQTSTTGSLVVTLEDNPVVALDTTSVVDLIHNPYGSAYGANAGTNGVVVTPTTFVGSVLGFTLYGIPASTTTGGSFGIGTLPVVGNPSYGYVLTNGIGSAIAEAAVPIGTPISPSTTTAGEIEQAVAATTVLSTPIIGYAVQAGVAGDSQMVYVQL